MAPWVRNVISFLFWNTNLQLLFIGTLFTSHSPPEWGQKKFRKLMLTFTWKLDLVMIFCSNKQLLWRKAFASSLDVQNLIFFICAWYCNLKYTTNLSLCIDAIFLVSRKHFPLLLQYYAKIWVLHNIFNVKR